MFHALTSQGLRVVKHSLIRVCKHSQVDQALTFPRLPFSYQRRQMAPDSHDNRQPFLVRFYDPAIAAPDAKGRTLATILAWDDTKLERCHDYIQVIFPLPEKSAFGWSAPVIDRATFETFRSRSELRASLKDSLVRILKFYGFYHQVTSEGSQIIRSSNFSEVARNWVTRMDHNHLRITRIIRSLRVLGLEPEAQAFYAALDEVYHKYKGRIGQRSMEFWTRAAKRPLFLAPDNDGDEEEGADFLVEFEKQKAEGSKNGLRDRPSE